MMGLGWQQDSRCGVMITVVVWFYRRVTVGGIAEDPGKMGGAQMQSPGGLGSFSLPG